MLKDTVIYSLHVSSPSRGYMRSARPDCRSDRNSSNSPRGAHSSPRQPIAEASALMVKDIQGAVGTNVAQRSLPIA